MLPLFGIPAASDRLAGALFTPNGGLGWSEHGENPMKYS
jgi:hypothetical protein